MAKTATKPDAAGKGGLHHFDVPLGEIGDFRVDVENGVIEGISLITSGITATGHALEVDDTTLAQMLACAETKKKLPVKWNHKSGADAVSGYLKNFRIVGNKLKGDWHLLKKHERYQHALELAQEMPESLGLSVSFSGKDEQVGGKKFARCTNLVSADLVATPAANPDGMFEAQVDSPSEGMAKAQATPQAGSASGSQPKKEFSLDDVMAGITALKGRFDTVEERLEGVEQFQADLQESAREFEEEQEDPNAGGGEQPRQFESIGDALVHLEARIDEIEDDAAQAESEAALTAFQEKVGDLVELNERLANQNRVMAAAIHEFNQASKERQIVFSAGQDGELTHSLTEPAEAGGDTEFEAKVAELVRDGKCEDEAEATLFAIQNHGDLYEKYLEEIQSNVRRI